MPASITLQQFADAKGLPLDFLKKEASSAKTTTASPFRISTTRATGSPPSSATALKAKDGSRWPAGTPSGPTGDGTSTRPAAPAN